MRRLRVALLAALAVAAVVAAFGPGRVIAQSATVAETAWWSRQPTNAPGTAFEVARAPDDAISVAAFRIRVDGQPSRTELQLAEIQTAGSASMQVCPTASPWTAGGPKDWNDNRPQPSCPGTPIRLAHNEIQRLYTVDILSLLAPGQSTVSLMVVPAPDESVTVPPPLPPAPVPTPTPPVTLPPPSTVPVQPPVPPPFTVSFSGATLLAEGGTAAFDPVTDPGFTPVESASGLESSDTFFATPEVPAADEVAAVAPSQVEGRFPQRGDVGLPPGEGADQPWGRAPLLAVVAAGIGAATSFGRHRMRDRGWLGAS